MNSRRPLETQSAKDVRVLCGWCGKVIRDSREPAMTSHGICATCARVLEPGARSDQSLPAGDLTLSAIEEQANQLMCRLYESRQLLLDLQHRCRDQAELLARVGQALTSLRQQERLVAEIQRRLVSTEP